VDPKQEKRVGKWGYPTQLIQAGVRKGEDMSLKRKGGDAHSGWGQGRSRKESESELLIRRTEKEGKAIGT